MKKLLITSIICCLALITIAQKDSTIIYNKGDYNIIEHNYYNENGLLQKQLFFREGKISGIYFSKEDLFQRAVKATTLVHGFVLDSLNSYNNKGQLTVKKTYHRNDGKILERTQLFNHDKTVETTKTIEKQQDVSQSYNAVFDLDYYKRQTEKSYYYSRLIGNQHNIYLNNVDKLILKKKLNKSTTHELTFHTKNYIVSNILYELYSKDIDLEIESSKGVVEGEEQIFKLQFTPTKNRQTYNLEVKARETNEIKTYPIQLIVETYHIAQSDFDKSETYSLSNTRMLRIYFEEGGGKLLRIYRNGEMISETSVSQIMNTINFKGFSKGEYTLKLVNLSANKQDSMTLILE